jgi:DNA-binding NarL/FixJ family response regulator
MASDSSEARRAGAVPATVVIVDDDRGLCELVDRWLNAEADMKCAGIATTAEEARRIVSAERPAVILLDFSLGSGVDALSLGGELVELSSGSQLLIWTKWTDPTPGGPEELNRMKRARLNGATDWVSKGEGINVLMERIRAAVRRGRPIEDSPIARRILDHLGLDAPAPAVPEDGLTKAERRWAREVARGSEHDMSIEEIARRNSVSAHTLRTHMKNIYEKWGVRSRAAFVKRAHEFGLV